MSSHSLLSGAGVRTSPIAAQSASQSKDGTESRHSGANKKPSVSTAFSITLVVGALLTILVLVLGSVIHGVALSSRTSSGPLHANLASTLRRDVLAVQAKVVLWQQRIASSNDSNCNMQLIKSRSDDQPPSIACEGESFDLGAYRLRYDQQNQVVVQHSEGVPLDFLQSYAAFVKVNETTEKETFGVKMLSVQAAPGRPHLDLVFISAAYEAVDGSENKHRCVASVTDSDKENHLLRSSILGLALLVAVVLSTLVNKHAGYQRIIKRMRSLQALSAAIETMDLGSLSMLRLADGEDQRNLRTALHPQDLLAYDDAFHVAIERVSEVRKHLPQIVLQTQGTLSHLLTVQATDVGAIDAKDLEFGGRTSPNSETVSSPNSPAHRSVNLMEITGAMMLSYDAQQSNDENLMSLSPARNPLAKRTSITHVAGNSLGRDGLLLDMVGPSDYRCFMLLKKATFVVCRLIVPEAIEEDLPRFHGISQAWLKTISIIAAQFDGLVHSVKLTEIILTWNAFKPYPFHESRGALCALHIASNMHPLEDDPLVAGEHIRWCLVVNTGVVVVSQSGSNNKLAPSIVGDSVHMATKVAQLAPSIHSNVVVMEPSHIVARNQIFSIPIDVIGDDSWKITLFDMKGKQEEHRSTDRSTYVEGFSLFTRHRFQEAEGKLFSTQVVEPQAKRLLKMCQLFQTVEDVSVLIPNPYHRQVPGWDFKELEADEIDVTEILSGPMSASLSPRHGSNLLLSPTQSTFLGVKPRSRRPSMLPEDYLRTEINRVRSSPFSAQTPTNLSGSQVQSPPEAVFDSFNRSPTNVFNESPIKPSFLGAEESFNSPDPKKTSLNGNSSAQLVLSPSILISASQSGIGNSPTMNGDSVVTCDPDDPLSWRDRRGAVWKISGKKLGEGSFGAVFLGLAEDGELVAIKQLPIPDGDTDKNKKEIEDVLTEVATISALRNEHVVRYYSSAVHMGKLVIAMEYVSGGSLSQLLNRFGALPPMSIRRYVKDILMGLKFLHAEGIVHRDINPNNVLLTVDGGCKLTDFGASKSINRLAVESDICGTPPFMAPEACRGNASTASDIWGVGVMLSHMYLGRLPWRPEDLYDVPAFLRRVASDPTYLPEIPGLKICGATEMDFMANCLARNERDRLTAEELLSHHFFMMN